jgi:hypothetical protein
VGPMMLDPLMLDPEDLEDEEEGMLEFLVRNTRTTFESSADSVVAVCPSIELFSWLAWCVCVCVCTQPLVEFVHSSASVHARMDAKNKRKQTKPRPLDTTPISHTPFFPPPLPPHTNRSRPPPGARPRRKRRRRHPLPALTTMRRRRRRRRSWSMRGTCWRWSRRWS